MSLTSVVCVILYIIVDVMYVSASQGFYNNVVERVQGTPIGSIRGTRMIAAVLSYFIMALGLLVLVFPLIDKYIEDSRSPILAGAMVGAVYGLVMYGVFNFTLHAMFKGYDLKAVSRDLVWGVSWATVISMLYAFLKMRS